MKRLCPRQEMTLNSALPGLLLAFSWLCVANAQGAMQSGPIVSERGGLSVTPAVQGPDAESSLTPIMLSPTNSSIIAVGQPFTLSGRFSDPSVLVLEFYEDGALIRTFPGNMASFSWSNAVAGPHSYYVRALVLGAPAATSEAVNILSRAPDAQATFFPEFTSLAGLYVTGRTEVVTNFLRLTSTTAGPKGAAFLQHKQPLTHGFETTFQFRMSGLLNGGADGIALVIQGGPMPVLGGAIGFDGVTNCLAVEYDTFMNPTHGDFNDNHISVHSRGILANTKYESNSLGWTANIANLSDELVHTTRITYVPGRLSVFLDDLTTPIITVKTNLASYLYLEGGLGWVGFTATIGTSQQNHDILGWSFTGTLPRVQLMRPQTDGAMLLEFSSVAGSRYAIQYSADFSKWFDSATPMSGTGDVVQWLDRGPPETQPPATGERNRYYRLRILP